MPGKGLVSLCFLGLENISYFRKSQQNTPALLSLFRINDPYRILGILFVLLLIRLPYFIFGQDLTVIELNWLLIGEKLADGGVMYRDVWDDTAPLSAGFFWLTDLVFGRSALAHHIISLVLVWMQAAIFNNMLLQNKAYNENTYVPALIYALLMNIFFDFYSLSPLLLSQTFILLAINNIFRRIDNKTHDQFFLNTGIFMGLASLFYLPAVLVFLALILSLILFTGSILRRYMLLVYGFMLPVSLCWLYYFWQDAHMEFLVQYVRSVLVLQPTIYYSFGSFLMIVAVPVLFLLFAFYQLFRYSRYVNFQVRLQYVMIFILVLCLFTFYFSKMFAPFQLIIFVPAFAFFISHYFLLIRRKLLAELVFLIFTLLLLGVNYGSAFNWSELRSKLSFERLIVQEGPYDALVEGKRVLYVGSDKSVYKNSYHTTPFLDWDLSERVLREPDYYDNVVLLYRYFDTNAPEVVIDPEGLLVPYFERMPGVAARYQRSALPDAWVLKSN